MTVEKVRVRKDLQQRVGQWAAVLEISESRLVDDAIRYYLRFLDGKPSIQFTTPLPLINLPSASETMIATEDKVSEIDEEFDGGIDL